MSGVASGGQKLTPIRNVSAPAGIGGDRWGANGGGITPVGGGVSGQVGWMAPLKANASDAESDLSTTAQPPADYGVLVARVSSAGVAVSATFIPGFAIPGRMLPGIQS